MSLTVVVQETALRALARIRSEDKSEDKEAFAAIRQALSALADQPRPGQAVAWGGGGIYGSAATVYVVNVARTA
jgi:hypothetical protein